MEIPSSYCLNTCNLNKAIIRELYYYQNVEDIITKLEGSTVFKICDRKKGYCISLHLTSILELLFPVICYRGNSVTYIKISLEFSAFANVMKHGKTQIESDECFENFL